MPYFLIMNPGSKGGQSKKRFELIFKLLNENNIKYDFEYTKCLDDAYRLSRKANQNGYDVIVAVGGDGTINRVIKGFYDQNGKRLSKAKLGIIYTGTSPDFCKSYHIPLDTKRAIKAVVSGKSKEIGIGRIESGGKARFFACCANIGLGAMLANNANNGIRKILGDFFGTFISLIKTLINYKPIDVCMNGKEYKKVYNISVGKTFYVASGIKIKNELRLDDDRFYILTIQNNIFDFMWRMYSGKPLHLEYAKEINISGIGKLEFDGDEGGELPCLITSVERLEVFCE